MNGYRNKMLLKDLKTARTILKKREDDLPNLNLCTRLGDVNEMLSSIVEDTESKLKRHGEV